jgi:hypothetical protein
MASCAFSIPLGQGVGAGGAQAKALTDTIATADHDALSYGEGTALIEAFNTATSDKNVTPEEMTAIQKMLEGFQKSGGCGSTVVGSRAAGVLLSLIPIFIQPSGNRSG